MNSQKNRPASSTVAAPPVSDRRLSSQCTLVARQYDNMLRCVRCGLCLPVCPTYQQTFDEAESPRGRIAMARAFAEGNLDFSADLWAHQESCLLCEACSAACPSGVQMEDIGIALRATVQPALRRPWLQSAMRALAFDGLFADPPKLRLAARLARLYQSSGLRRIARRTGMLRRLGVQRIESLLPDIDEHFLVPDEQVWQPSGSLRHRVALFAGCVTSTALARLDFATARVLAANGCLVLVARGQVCCGALHAHEGELERARALARRNIDVFDRLDVGAIVVNAAGCGSTLKRYDRLLADDPDYAARAAGFVTRVRDVHEFLVEIGLQHRPGRLDVAVTYQEPCHLAHAQRVSEAPRSLLRAIPGLRVVELSEASLCCGSAGLYNLRQPEMADGLLRRKVCNVLATGAEIVASANPGCMLQLKAGLREAGSGIAVKHVVELLDDAYRNSGRE